MDSRLNAHERLILALDVADGAVALQWARRLRPLLGMVKVGLELFVAAGPDLVRRLVDEDVGVFLDLKFHDIPNTVAGAVRSGAALGARMMTVHAAGGPAMLAAAVTAAEEFAQASGKAAPRLLGVTLLTSLGPADLERMAMPGAPSERVLACARLCQEQRLPGVVASAHEVAALRRECGSGLTLVIPGIRPAGAPVGDQARVATPADAIRAGADYLVLGRAVTAAPDSEVALAAIVQEVAGAIAARD